MSHPGPPPPWGYAPVPIRPPRPLPKWPFVLGGGILLTAIVAFALIFIIPFAILGKVFTDLDRASDKADADRATRTRIAEAVGPPPGYVETGRVDSRSCLSGCGGVKLVFQLPGGGSESVRTALAPWIEGSGVSLVDRDRTEAFLSCAEALSTEGQDTCRLTGSRGGQPVTFVATAAEDPDHPTWSGEERAELVVGPEPTAPPTTPSTPTTR